MRAISTVLDVALFLLLVSAAAGTVVLTSTPQEVSTSADETVEVLASSTLSLEYDLRGEPRHAHGTAAVLLARAAVANASIDGRHLSTMDGPFHETVQTAVRERLAAPNRTQVVARWRPYRGAPLSGTVTVGPTPPPDTDVHTATVTVPVSVPDSHTTATDASNGSHERYVGVATAVATSVANGLLPDDRVDASVFRESPTAIASTQRYRAVAGATGVDVTEALAAGAIGTAHERAVGGLTRRFSEDMRDRFDTSGAAAETVRTGSVRITVRRWQP